MIFTLPKPNGGFRWVQLPGASDGPHGRPALVCDALEPFACHFFTTRAWKLGEPAAMDSAWIEVAEAAAVDPTRLDRLHQAHGAAAVVRRKPGRHETPATEAPRDAGADEADIIMTDDPTRAIAVKAADCLPILIVDRRTHAVAAAHAGWRGLAARVPIVTVERMGEEFGSRGRDLLVAVGPAIGACCYEVGDDVRARFAAFPPNEVGRWFAAEPSVWSENPPIATLSATRRPGHCFFNGWQCAGDQLLTAGVPSDQIFVAELCTASHPLTFCSYRRDGAGATGRMVGVIRTTSRSHP